MLLFDIKKYVNLQKQNMQMLRKKRREHARVISACKIK